MEHPEIRKVEDVARAAGEAWQAIAQEKKEVYEAQSREAKVGPEKQMPCVFWRNAIDTEACALPDNRNKFFVGFTSIFPR